MNKTRPVLAELTGHTPGVTASVTGGYSLYPAMTTEHVQFPERKILESLEGKDPPNRTVIFQYILLFYLKYVITVTWFKYKNDIKISVRTLPPNFFLTVPIPDVKKKKQNNLYPSSISLCKYIFLVFLIIIL